MLSVFWHFMNLNLFDIYEKLKNWNYSMKLSLFVNNIARRNKIVILNNFQFMSRHWISNNNPKMHLCIFFSFYESARFYVLSHICLTLVPIPNLFIGSVYSYMFSVGRLLNIQNGKKYARPLACNSTDH